MSTFRILFSFPILIISTVVHAQPDTGLQNQSFGRGRIKTTEGKKIGFTSITLGQKVHTYIAKSSKATLTIDIAKVSKVEVRNGSYVLEAGIGLAVVGLVGSVAGIASWNNKMGQDGIDNDARKYVILGSTVGCALIGALMGLLFKKHKTVYSNPGFSIDLGPGMIEVSFL